MNLARRYRRIILLAFQFPPYSHVGGYRWGFLSRHMVTLGYQLDVLTVDWQARADFYEKNYPGINVHVLPSGAPHNVRNVRFKNTFFNTLLNLPFRFVIDPYFFPHDFAQRWQKHVMKKLNELQPDDSTVLIATGAPFSVNSLLTPIRQKYPNLKLIQDFQDVWSQNPYVKKNGFEEQMEKKAVEEADAVVAVSPMLLQSFVAHKPSVKNKVIENGYDDQLIEKVSAKTAHEKNKPLRLVHLGSVTNGRDQAFIKLLEALETDAILYENICIYQVGAITSRLKYKLQSRFGKLLESGRLRLQPTMPQAKALEFLKQGDFALLLNSPDLLYALSTKVYEYAALQMPILSLNYGGEIEKWMLRTNFGISVNLKNTDLVQILHQIVKNDFSLSASSKDVKQFSYSEIAKQYSELIESL